MKTLRIIYANWDKYHVSDAVFSPSGKTVSVGVWSKRNPDDFTWGVATPELEREAKELSRAADALRKQQKAFDAKLTATRALTFPSFSPSSHPL